VFATWIYAPKSNCLDNPNNRASYGSATMSYIGTFFLWWFYPSFNSFNKLYAIRIPNIPYFPTRYLAIMNTIFALTSSVVTSFWISKILKKGKFSV